MDLMGRRDGKGKVKDFGMEVGEEKSKARNPGESMKHLRLSNFMLEVRSSLAKNR